MSRGQEAAPANAAPRAQSAALWQVRHGFAELALQVPMLALGTHPIRTTRGSVSDSERRLPMNKTLLIPCARIMAARSSPF